MMMNASDFMGKPRAIDRLSALGFVSEQLRSAFAFSVNSTQAWSGQRLTQSQQALWFTIQEESSSLSGFVVMDGCRQGQLPIGSYLIAIIFQ